MMVEMVEYVFQFNHEVLLLKQFYSECSIAVGKIYENQLRDPSHSSYINGLTQF